MIRSNVFDYSYAYILAKGTITVPNMVAAAAAVTNTNKKLLDTINRYSNAYVSFNRIQ